MAMVKLNVLVIDDERGVLRLLQRDLTEMGCEVHVAEGGEEGLRLFSEHAFDLVLVDLRMPEPDGLEVMRRLHAQQPDVLVVIMTGYGSVDSAVTAIKAGAADFLTKPIDEAHLKVVFERAAEKYRQRLRLQLLEEQVVQQSAFEGMVGISTGMRAVYDLIRQVASSDVTVLIQGETGTGKELVAKAIHNRSRQTAGPFVPVNCGALTESLLETELFGHERGAFTGAHVRRQGLFEQASGGTLFLDEVQAMSPGLQARLLRVIQDRMVRRVGGDEAIRASFRLLVATNRDLKALIDAGAFRTDLYYRLNTVTIDLPPLRARHTDIPLLVRHFAGIWAEKNSCMAPAIPAEAMMALTAYSWPGNVRELENAVNQMLVLGTKDELTLADLPESIAGTEVPVWDLPLKEALGKFEQDYLERKLAEANGRVIDAAHLSGIRRERFYEKMRRYGIRSERL